MQGLILTLIITRTELYFPSKYESLEIPTKDQFANTNKTLHDETDRGLALYEDSDLSVVVWKLSMAGYGRSEEREGVAGERREMLWVTLR